VRAGYVYVVPSETTSSDSELEAALRRIAELEAALTSTTSQLSSTASRLATATETLSKTTAALASITAERDKLRRAYEQLEAQLELSRRRIFLAKAERIDTQQLELEFAETQAKLVQLASELGEADAAM
jgi:chromosome segregation ATPase